MSKCPIHKTQLFTKTTRFGTRLYCPEKGCTVAKWNGETSTPADHETRQARREAHRLFDGLWWEKRFDRQRLYKKLAHHLYLPINKTHIGYFDKEQCRKVIEFTNTIIKEKK